MVFLDVVLIVFVAAFVFFGLFFGLVHTLGSLIGAIIGIVVGTRLIEPAFDMFGFLFGGGEIGKVIMFILLFVIISRVIGLIFWVAEKMLGFVSMIPFAKSLNRILGGLLGFVEGVIVVGVIVFYALQVLPEDTILAALDSSTVSQYLVTTVSKLQFFFPEDLKIL